MSLAAAAGWDSYFAFRRAALLDLAAAQGLEPVDEPGLVGAVGPAGNAQGALLVVAPDASGRLGELLGRSCPEFIAVIDPASELLGLVTEAGWSLRASYTAMAADDLTEVPELPLPEPYRLHLVELDAAGDSLSLEEALLIDVMHGSSAATTTIRDLPAEVEHLRQLPGVILYAALDPHDLCVATAGSRVVGTSAVVSAVATIPAARRRGLAAALTSAAVRAAAAAGATGAFLDAAEGASLYRRLGFRELGTVAHCRRPAELPP